MEESAEALFTEGVSLPSSSDQEIVYFSTNRDWEATVTFEGQGGWMTFVPMGSPKDFFAKNYIIIKVIVIIQTL